MFFVKIMYISFSVHIILAILYNKVNTDDISTTPTTAENRNEVFLNDDTVHNWSSPQFPNPYPPQNQFLIIKCDAGYSVLFFIRNLDLDGDGGDFLVIKPGTALDENSEGRVFTYKLKDKYTYLVNSNSVIVSLQVSGKNEAKKTGFSIFYKRYDEAEKPTHELATSPWLELAENKSDYITVFVSGKTQLEFSTTKVQAEFKTAVNQMATEYCKSNKFLLTREITDENVQIQYLAPCPVSWPESEVCMKIHFAVPLDVVENSSWSGYQISAFHLKQMWHDFGNKYLEQYGMRIHIQSSNNSNLNWWIIILCSTVVLFAALLYLLRANIPKYDFKKNKMNGISTIPHHYKPSKTLKMSNHPCSQSVPPNFPDDDYYCWYKHSDSDDEVLYPNTDKKTKKDNHTTTNISYA